MRDSSAAASMARVFAAAGVWGRKETETDGGAAAAALKREGVLAYLLVFFYSCHYNFPTFEICHYNSPILKLVITLLRSFESCHFIRL